MARLSTKVKQCHRWDSRKKKFNRTCKTRAGQPWCGNCDRCFKHCECADRTNERLRDPERQCYSISGQYLCKQHQRCSDCNNCIRHCLCKKPVAVTPTSRRKVPKRSNNTIDYCENPDTPEGKKQKQDDKFNLDSIIKFFELEYDGTSQFRSRTKTFQDYNQRNKRYAWSLLQQMLSKIAIHCFGTDTKTMIKDIYQHVPSSREDLNPFDDYDYVAHDVGMNILESIDSAGDNVHLREDLLQMAITSNSSATSFDRLNAIYPWLTRHTYKKVRKKNFAAEEGLESSKELRRAKVSDEELEQYVDFFTRSDNLQDVAFGAFRYKMSEESDFVVPNWQRKMLRSELYRKWEKENPVNPRSVSLFYSIANLVSRTDQKALAGLDNTDVDGKQALQDLADMLSEAKITHASVCSNIDISKFKIAEVNLLDCKLTLKQHLQDNLSATSRKATHCINHAFYDPNTMEPCDHDHVNCEYCEKFFSALDFCQEVADKVLSSDDLSQEEKDMYKHDFDNSKEDLHSWIHHIVRTVVQGKMQSAVLSKMGADSVYILMDWAMKWLSKWHREKMEQFFGKAGISWHEMIVYYKNKDDDEEAKMFSLTYVANESLQTADQVFYLVADALKVIKRRVPAAKSVYLQSDNAGCYNSLMLLVRLALADLGILTKEHNFSEACDGKDHCDRLIAPKKAHLRKEVARSANAFNASQLVELFGKMTSLSGDHKCFQYLPFDPDDNPTLKFRSTKDIKNFSSRYSQVEFVYNEEGKWTGFNVREQFDIGEKRFIEKEKFILESNIPSTIPTEVTIRMEGTMGKGSFLHNNDNDNNNENSNNDNGNRNNNDNNGDDDEDCNDGGDDTDNNYENSNNDNRNRNNNDNNNDDDEDCDEGGDGGSDNDTNQQQTTRTKRRKRKKVREKKESKAALVKSLTTKVAKGAEDNTSSPSSHCNNNNDNYDSDKDPDYTYDSNASDHSNYQSDDSDDHTVYDDISTNDDANTPRCGKKYKRKRKKMNVYECQTCSAIFIKKGNYLNHMKNGKHLKLKTKSMNDRVGSILRKKTYNTIRLTSLHTRSTEPSVDDVEFDVPNEIRVKEGWARKNLERKRGTIAPAAKEFILELFLKGLSDDGSIDKARKVNPTKAEQLLRDKVKENGWKVETHALTEKQIRSLFSRFKSERRKAAHMAYTNSLTNISNQAEIIRAAADSEMPEREHAREVLDGIVTDIESSERNASNM